MRRMGTRKDKPNARTAGALLLPWLAGSKKVFSRKKKLKLLRRRVDTHYKGNNVLTGEHAPDAVLNRYTHYLFCTEAPIGENSLAHYMQHTLFAPPKHGKDAN